MNKSAGLLMLFLAALLAAPSLAAQSHIVSSAELHEAVEAKSYQREQNLQQVSCFLAGPHGEEVLHSAKLSMQEATDAVAHLSDEELDRLAAKTQEAERLFAENDFAGGRSAVAWVLLAVLLAFIAFVVYGLYSLTHNTI